MPAAKRRNRKVRRLSAGSQSQTVQEPQGTARPEDTLRKVRDCWSKLSQGGQMQGFFTRLWRDEEGQDIAEYAVMLAVILVIVIGTVRLIGSNANTVFSRSEEHTSELQ